MNRKFTPLEIIGIIILAIIGINLLQFLTGVVFSIIKLAFPIFVIAGAWYYFSNQKSSYK
ncbi:hypothetical protein [Vagococcus fluvialis]|uniref:hypothetical protein n=1 Tax=Vagococcus fluvialis TaxID=2738 RepID=UPI001D0B0D50|nr:hypothetical protein [Vagococcus fluvialis]UDM78639.1 hypothetical protein K5K97_07840 [Vagococcus fluvialis]